MLGTFEIDTDTGEVTFFVTSTKTINEDRKATMINFIENANYNIVVSKRLSREQRKKIWCLLDDFAYCLGGDKEQWREQLQTIFCAERSLEYFSISEIKKDGASVEIATEFIQWLVELGIEQGVFFRGSHAVEWIPDITRYIIACLKSRRCCISQEENADIHHVESVGVSGYNTDYADDLLVIPLARRYHNEVHNIGNKDFLEKYILQGVPYKLAKGVYTNEEIKKEIREHKNPKTNRDYKKGK